MSKGNDSRVGNGRGAERGQRTSGRSAHEVRTSRSSVSMTAARARALQARTAQTGSDEEDEELRAPPHAEDEPNGPGGNRV